MEKQYQNIETLIKKFGFGEAISYKFLEFRDKYPLANRLFSEFIIGHTNSGAYSSSYVAQWDSKGILAYFNPNPKYSDDFRPIDHETWQPVKRLSDEEFKKRLPIEFAHTVYQILRDEK